VVLSGWEYDQEGFFDFPERKGLNAQDLIDSGTHGLTIRELESFVQAWLFFGLLGEFCTGTTGVSMEPFVKLDNFGQKAITTEHLLKYLGIWHAYMREWIPSAERFIRRRLMRMDLVLKDAKLIVLKYCSSTYTQIARWGINPSIAISIMVLGETLTWAVSQLQQEVAHHGIGNPGPGWTTTDDRGWGTSHLLTDRMMKRRWCPGSIYILQGLIKSSVSGLYYASTKAGGIEIRPLSEHQKLSYLRNI
jgi:hypothetical protein